MRIRTVLPGFLGLLLSISAFAQNKSVSVNNYTGSLNVAIPLYNVTSGPLSVPVTAVYQTNGVKVKDKSNAMGINWHLSAGGEISRTLRGLPDDIKKDNLANARLGWLYNTNGTKINAFTIANDNNPAVCTDETADNNYISTNFSDLSDTEPDIFNVNAPGLSCQFVFDNGHVIRTIPYQDLKITYETDATTGAITYFTVVNDKGVTYTFGSPLVPIHGPSDSNESETRRSVSSGAVSYFKRPYDQYVNGITYTRAWKLMNIATVSGEGINIGYAAVARKTYNVPVTVVLPGASYGSNQYTIAVSYTPLLPAKIWLGEDGDTLPSIVTFVYTPNGLCQFMKGMGRTIYLTYEQFNSPGIDRAFLKGIAMTGGGAKRTFSLDYNGLTYSVLDINGNVSTPGSLNLPDSTSKQIDYWGYYNASGATSLVPQVYINPSNTSLERYRNIAPGTSISNYPYTITGTNRDASITGTIKGSLNRITSDLGDTTTVEYELNNFYDNTAGSVIQGGGIRVKKLTALEGANIANNIITNYSYVNPSSTISSGRAVTMPVYAFTTPYTGSGTDAVKWTSSTVRSEEDLSNEDESIVYNYVKVSRTGTGNILYEYSVPATNWDSSALPDWAPTVVNSGRVSCGTVTFANNQAKNYPYPPNPNFDFERGLLRKMSTYNQAGQQTSEESYTYQRSYTLPTVVTGFKFDNNTASSRNYAKYSIYAGTSELIAQQTKKVFDLPALTSSQTSTTAYNYTGTAHKLMTSTATTNSDGSITQNFIKYVKDYTTTLGADSMANALYRLKQKNINVPIEQYQQVQRGANTVTTSASLTLYKYFDAYRNSEKPWKSLQLVSANGLTNFQPSGITSNVFTYDNTRYTIKSNYLGYDVVGVLQSMDDNHHQIMTTFTDFSYNQPFVAIKNALAKEMIFDDFDSHYSKNGFAYSDTIKRRVDRNGNFAVTIKPTYIINGSVVKNTLASNYVFSLWVNTTVSSTIAVEVSDNTHTNNAVLTVPNTAGKWRYLEVKMPVANLTTTTFFVRFTPSVNIQIDDVLFYPENAQVNTTAYDPNGYVKLSETNANGIAVYYGYDEYDRLKFVYDQDKNIVKKTIYLASRTIQQTDTLSISADIKNYNNPSTFTALNIGDLTTDGMSYTWNFGDGSAAVTTRLPSVQHTYHSSATFAVTLTRSSPFYSTKTVSSSYLIPDHGLATCRLIGGGLPGADVTYMQAYKNGAFVGGWSAADLSSGNYSIPQGIYDITVSVDGELYNPSTHLGYKSVALYLAGRPSAPCQNRNNKPGTGAVGYTFHADLNGATQLGVQLSIDVCPPLTPVE